MNKQEFNEEYIKTLQREHKIEIEVLGNRNELINTLLERFCLSEKEREEGLRLRRECWDRDSKIFASHPVE